ncbi:hypothetical protein DUI87_10866 [Hirundo rustica rustica]|uniref:Uncharacterized protein n=1 Tax=Hirundo rustica rustica TaxID=333673 RepID=A0A3M0KL15_HIRRU|nr:hypothetical protein DUI87_10866 [Hirundo rustica rustica]
MAPRSLLDHSATSGKQPKQQQKMRFLEPVIDIPLTLTNFYLTSQQSPQVDFHLQHALQGLKEPGTKASKGAKGKKDEKQEAAKEGTTPSENGENKAEELRTVVNTLESLLNSAIYLVPGGSGTMNVGFEVIVVMWGPGVSIVTSGMGGVKENMFPVLQ